jgi:hypothetical protein
MLHCHQNVLVASMVTENNASADQILFHSMECLLIKILACKSSDTRLHKRVNILPEVKVTWSRKRSDIGFCWMYSAKNSMLQNEIQLTFLPLWSKLVNDAIPSCYFGASF